MYAQFQHNKIYAFTSTKGVKQHTDRQKRAYKLENLSAVFVCVLFVRFSPLALHLLCDLLCVRALLFLLFLLLVTRPYTSKRV